MSDDETSIRMRASDACELCGGVDELELFHLQPEWADLSGAMLLCGTCRTQRDEAKPDPEHFRYALQGSIWSEVPAIQALSWRLLKALESEIWARELIEQAYLTDDVLEWAKAGIETTADDRPPAFDSNGTPLADGDSVTLIKDLDVKGANFTAKRGTLVKGIRLTDNPEHVEGKVNRMAIVLRTEFLKRA